PSLARGKVQKLVQKFMPRGGARVGAGRPRIHPIKVSSWIGRGGVRVGSGRKRKPGQRTTTGRLRRLKSAICNCGKPMHIKASKFLDCFNIERAVRPKPCAYCGSIFIGKCRCCSSVCAQARLQMNWLMMRDSESERARKRR